MATVADRDGHERVGGASAEREPWTYLAAAFALTAPD